MYEVENDISLYIVYKVITIILISNEYYQFRTWYNTNITGEKYMDSIAKDIEV